MKKIVMLLVYGIVVLVLSVGCARILPDIIDPRVYNSAEKRSVAEDDAKTEKFKSDIQAQVLARERAKAIQEEYLKEIKGEEAAPEKTKIITSNGVIGGFPVILINKSAYKITFIIRSVIEGYGEQMWYFPVPRHWHKEVKLPAGRHKVQWIREDYNSYIYPKDSYKFCTVKNTPFFWYEETSTNYFGACVVTDN